MREPAVLAVALAWMQHHCRVPDGFRRGKPFVFYDYQLDYESAFYTVRGDAEWRPESPMLATAFLYRRGMLVGPQKIGKNPMVAAQTCLEGVGPSLFAGWAEGGEVYRCIDWGCGCGWTYTYRPGEPMGMPRPTPLIEITAYSEDSTANTYSALRPMIELGPLHELIPHTGEDFIRLPDLYGSGYDPDNTCRINTVTSSPGSRLGGRPTFCPQDEVGIWTPRNGMVKLAQTQYRNLAGTGGRASLTTNAWDPAEQSVAQQEYEFGAEDVYRQFVEPPKNLSYTDKRDRHKIHCIVYPKDTWRENGGHVELAGIEAEAADLVEKDANQAERFFGNRRVAGAGAAVDPEHWDHRLALPRDVPRGAYVGAGFDGSISDDATFLRACLPDGYSFIVGKWERPTGDALLEWQARHPRETWKVPRTDVDERVAWMFGQFRVGLFLCDPFKWWTEVETWAAKYGPKVVLAFETNQQARMAPAFDRWLVGVREGTHTHDGDERTSEHVKALHLKKVKLSAPDDDGRTKYIPVKGEDKRKIDGGIADILAYEAAMTMPPLPPSRPKTYGSF